MSGYNPALGTAPEARMMLIKAAAAHTAYLKTHQHQPETIACSFASAATCALPIVIERDLVAPNVNSPATLMGLAITIDDSIPYGEFQISDGVDG